ncbi:MAG: hypothetical protein V2B15_13750 [Bacteroidota bacterium]
MFRRVFIILFLTAGITSVVYSQIRNVNIGGSYNGTFLLSGGVESDYQIAGSPYLSDTWMFGTLEMKEGILEETPANDTFEIHGLFRYNLYAQEFEMVYNRDTFAISAPFNVRRIRISNMDFCYGLFVERSNRKTYLGSAYFQILSSGKRKLLMRHGTKIKSGSAPVTYGWAGGSDAFVPFRQLYYQEREGSEVILLKNRRKIIRQLFADRSEEIEKFIRSEKINIHVEAGLVRVFNYYNNLDS